MKFLWKTIIIDDEELARKRLKKLVKIYPNLDLVAEAANGEEGFKLVSSLNPDLIFLDIEMPVLNGFEMLSKLEKQPRVVFTTAFDQYAIRAFEENSIDYLLKPIELQRFDKTIIKLDEVHSGNGAENLNIQELIKSFHSNSGLKTLTVKIGDKILLIKLFDIVFIEADDRYVMLHTKDGHKHLTDYTLSFLEEKLPDQFLRIHRRAIINTECVDEIRKGFNGAFIFIMNNSSKSRIMSSRSNSEFLKERLGI